jgi:multidrug efflux pump subunit AcrA (membrane-fusion protein)
VRVLKIGATPATRSFELAGEVRAQHEIRLAFRVGGKIVERLVDVGALVRAGQPIARLDANDLALAATSAKAQVASAEAERALAAADHGRYKELRDKNFISQAEYDRRANALSTTEARLDALRAQHRQATNLAGYAILSADTAGVITAIEAEAGQVVTAGQTVARLARQGDKEIAIAVPESQREFIERATDFLDYFECSARPVLEGAVARAFARRRPGDPHLRRARHRCRGWRRYRMGHERPGCRGCERRSFEDRSARGGALCQGRPGAGTRRQWRRHCQPRAVQTAGLAGERVVIASGLNPGDVVVAAGAQLLRPGQRVRVIEGS